MSRYENMRMNLLWKYINKLLLTETYGQSLSITEFYCGHWYCMSLWCKICRRRSDVMAPSIHVTWFEWPPAPRVRVSEDIWYEFEYILWIQYYGVWQISDFRQTGKDVHVTPRDTIVRVGTSFDEVSFSWQDTTIVVHWAVAGCRPMVMFSRWWTSCCHVEHFNFEFGKPCRWA